MHWLGNEWEHRGTKNVGDDSVTKLTSSGLSLRVFG